MMPIELLEDYLCDQDGGLKKVLALLSNLGDAIHGPIVAGAIKDPFGIQAKAILIGVTHIVPSSIAAR